MTTRHEFLAQLHELLKPKVYLEIGVQHGWSLQLSKAEHSFGIDPHPLFQDRDHHKIYQMTSDEFFDKETGWDDDINGKIDFAFIDGMHLAEFAWRDFINVAKYCHGASVVVFDDVLPNTEAMAAREQCPGDWTGDVWKVFYELRYETDYVLALVDTEPTGTLVVTGFGNGTDPATLPHEPGRFGSNASLFPEVINRWHAWSAPAVIDNLQSRGFGQCA